MTEIHGKSILVQVSARFELARVRVIGSRLYIAVEFIKKAILAICKRFMFIVTEDSYLTKNLDEVKSAVIGQGEV